MVVGRSLALSISGVALGMAALVAISRRINPAMHGVSSSDPLTLSWLAIALVAVAILAALIPARLATRVDPLSSLCDG
jgi:ABC-type antimicrobial peptide transport system permease subunit